MNSKLTDARTATHEAQVQFLLRIQRLLNEGVFTATYKYALFLSLADIAVESGDDSGGVLVVPISLIAEKYIAYYWRHAARYVPQAGAAGVILRQNTDRQAAIVTAIGEARRLHATLAELERDRPEFRRLIVRVKGYFWEQPLWRLQRIGDEVLTISFTKTGRSELGLRLSNCGPASPSVYGASIAHVGQPDPIENHGNRKPSRTCAVYSCAQWICDSVRSPRRWQLVG